MKYTWSILLAERDLSKILEYTLNILQKNKYRIKLCIKQKVYFKYTSLQIMKEDFRKRIICTLEKYTYGRIRDFTKIVKYTIIILKKNKK